MTCDILNEDTQPVIRAIGVSHTACSEKSFDKIFDLTAGVYFNFYTPEYYIFKHVKNVNQLTAVTAIVTAT